MMNIITSKDDYDAAEAERFREELAGPLFNPPPKP
jgi:hypothetical protein